ncbi:MAG: heavy metal-associated domain-containing protein, partial [Pseudomonadota bacterium]
MAAALVNTVLHVSGLSCGSCVSRAEAALRAVPGVSQANVNLADKRAQISFD